MQFLTIRELSKSPKDALAKLDLGKKAILTNNGKPHALMIKINEDNFEQMITLIEQLEFQWVVSEMRMESMKNGNWKMSMDDINKEIKTFRNEKRKRNKK